ncbi:site-specific integrase [Streptomyces sp. 8K308]|uniref:tyrosine-type recombinase/integrase n=1 Tax=Streptomyces sp. 8K308 TaxID=2530388 RepID=UPI001FB58CFC|nr:site-specific integrase [Streptomyces sp. 8K308]
MAKTKVWRGSQHKPMSPKTLRNLHGLLSSILNEAVQAEPPLRARNPCARTRLPRADDDGIDDDEIGEDICFCTPEEVAGIRSCFDLESDKDVVDDLYGTGGRWGEITAVARRHVDHDNPAKPRLKIVRAWKRHPDKGWYLGKTKSRAGRRSVRIDAELWARWAARGVRRLGPHDLIHHNGRGERLPYSTFYDRWEAAVRRAHELGLLPEHKHPTIHDLRHSHAAALISKGHSLTYVQRRLGHESIKTTSDLYGHLLPEADDEAMATVSEMLRRAGPQAALEKPLKGPAARFRRLRSGRWGVGPFDVMAQDAAGARCWRRSARPATGGSS